MTIFALLHIEGSEMNTIGRNIAKHVGGEQDYCIKNMTLVFPVVVEQETIGLNYP